MRRKNGEALVRNEERILLGALQLKTSDTQKFHGYLLNKHITKTQSKGLVMSTMYRSLARLTERGLLTAAWELPPNSEQWRRVYELTGEGAQVASALKARSAAEQQGFEYKPSPI